MKIVVINAGSSSLKVKLFDTATRDEVQSYLVEHIGEKGAGVANHHEALESLEIDFSGVDGVGHRVVHGGEYFSQATLIDEDVVEKLRDLIPLAPLHNPANITGIEVVQSIAPELPQVAVFDTAFHTTMPKEAYIYALPQKLSEEYHIRRYGFHGTSHAYVAREAAKQLKRELTTLKLITLHLGNGASVCAIQNGKSIDTSMGFSPLEGLVMGTRCGDIDPEIVLYLQERANMTPQEVSKLLNKQSGLLGISGENDLRELLARDDADAQLAIDMMVRRIQKYMGGYMALLGDVDAFVFTGGIGENSELIRERVLDSKLFCGIKSLVIQTDEELAIATEVAKLLKKTKKPLDIIT